MTLTRGQSGFSLVEVLVVLTIMAVTAGLTVTALPGDDRRALVFAERLAGRIDLAADHALLSRRAMVLNLAVDQAEFSGGADALSAPRGVRLIAEQDRFAIDPAGGAPGFAVSVSGGGRTLIVIFNGLDASVSPGGAP